MINNIKNRGESLTEVLIAVGVLVVVLVTSFLLINRGLATNISVKNKIIAINIAREGLEGVRNVRDTNWIKYSGNRRNKWICLDEIVETPPPSVLVCNNRIPQSRFTIDFNQEFQRFLLKESTQQTDIDLSSGITNFSEYRLYKDSIDSRYTHVSTGGNNGTIFYRQIILTAQNEEQCGGSPCAGVSGEKMLAVSRVQWIEPVIAGESSGTNELVGSIVLETYLYDYLGRDTF